MVAKDYNAGFGLVRIYHLIWFDGEDAHGRYCSWGSFLSKTVIFCQSKTFVCIKGFDGALLFEVAFKPGLLIGMVV